MSEAKSPKKADAGSKAPEVKKTEVKKPEATQSATASETASADKAADKTVVTPKSASQSSISHFSNVSTPAYRAGWNNIFGRGRATDESKSKTNTANGLPILVTIADDNIDDELRAMLYRALQREADNQGISIAKMQNQSVIEYNIDCSVRNR